MPGCRPETARTERLIKGGRKNENMKELSIYIHIPFCIRKCLYCDFLSFPTGGGHTDAMREYADCLCREIRCSAPFFNKYQALSIFLGGGTPTLLPPGTIASLLAVLRESFHIAEDAEITVEMNPETAAPDKLREYITAGINRLSIGLQSTDDAELERIGRIHDYRTFLRAYELAREAGFRNINVDLMAALPGQDTASYRRTLERVAALAPEHISAYSLMLEEGTPLYEQRERFAFPGEDEDREMYALTKAFLQSRGYRRYEISNYAHPGYECRHNQVYWQRGNYVGFGLGASSMTDNVRWRVPATPEAYRRYVDSLPEAPASSQPPEPLAPPEAPEPAETLPSQGTFPLSDAGAAEALQPHVLTTEEQMEEYMFLGLRLMRGVDVPAFGRQFGRTMEQVYGGVIDTLCAQGLLERAQDRLRLTDRGIDISNYVMAQFLLA